MAMNTINDLVARAKRRQGKSAKTVRNGHGVRVTIDSKGRTAWFLLRADGWKRMAHAAVCAACGEA